MGTVNRGIKNAFRNSVRTLSITLILALSIAMSLVMLMATKTVDSKIASVKGNIGNMITVTPAGVRGFEGGGELLTESDATTIASLPNVINVIKVVTDRLTNGENTSLQSAIEPGSFGERQQRRSGSSQNDNGGTGSQAPTNFTMPVMVTGTNNLTDLASLNVSELKITSGEKFDPATTENVTIIGTDLATKNNLSVGSTFTAYSQNVKVVGIYDSGNKFSNSTVIMPIKALQTLSSQTDQINSMVVQANSMDNLDSVQEAIKSKLGDKVDVVSQRDSVNSAVEPLQNIKTISTYSLIGAVVAGAVIILLVMMMIARERRREIGVLKAIGASNIKIVSQFIYEAMVLTLLGSVVGIVLGFIFSNPVLNVLVNNNQSSGGRGGPGGGMMRFIGGPGGAMGALRDLHAVVGWEIIVYGLVAAIIIAIIGSAVPAFVISKIRPAEVMRTE